MTWYLLVVFICFSLVISDSHFDLWLTYWQTVGSAFCLLTHRSSELQPPPLRSLCSPLPTSLRCRHCASEYTLLHPQPRTSDHGGSPHLSTAGETPVLESSSYFLRLSHRKRRSTSSDFATVQLLSHVWLFTTPWTAAHQASLSIISWSLLKLMSIESMRLSNHLLLFHPLLLLPSIFPSIGGWVSSSHQVPKYWSFSFSISPSNEYSALISFRTNWSDLLAVQGTLKSLLQHHSSKASILRHSDFFMVQLSYPCMTTGKIIALTIWTFVGKVTSVTCWEHILRLRGVKEAHRAGGRDKDRFSWGAAWSPLQGMKPSAYVVPWFWLPRQWVPDWCPLGWMVRSQSPAGGTSCLSRDTARSRASYSSWDNAPSALTTTGRWWSTHFLAKHFSWASRPGVRVCVWTGEAQGMCVCVCVCGQGRLGGGGVCMCVCVFVCGQGRLRVYVYICGQGRLRVCVCVCVCGQGRQGWGVGRNRNGSWSSHKSRPQMPAPVSAG